MATANGLAGVLVEEFLRPMDVSQVRLAEHLGVSVQRINELVNGGVVRSNAVVYAMVG